MAGPRNLVLVGFMGCGKTAVGKLVAPRLGLRFIDIDAEVVRDARRSIVEIFNESGEPEFRRLEREAVRRAAAGRGGVVAPGGGAVMDDASWRLLLDGNLVVRLDASTRALLRRIRGREDARGPAGRRPRDIRPLADVPADAPRWPPAARRRVVALIAQREARYAESPLTLDTTGRSTEKVARAVERVAREAGLGPPVDA